jgi:hypothetical protein
MEWDGVLMSVGLRHDEEVQAALRRKTQSCLCCASKQQSFHRSAVITCRGFLEAFYYICGFLVSSALVGDVAAVLRETAV